MLGEYFFMTFRFLDLDKPQKNLSRIFSSFTRDHRLSKQKPKLWNRDLHGSQFADFCFKKKSGIH